MKPAFSVLIFTVCSGAGYGLIMWMLGMQMLSNNPVDTTELFIGGAIGLFLVTLGLLSSTLHLANPKNAWRAFNRFRTSWLSREGVFAVLLYPLFLGYVLTLWLNQGSLNSIATLLGVVSLVIALLTVFSTGMIYASLKPIRQWHNPLTTPLYILFSLMSGSLLYALLSLGVSGEFPLPTLWHFAILVGLSGVTKLIYFIVIGKPDGATINTATGFSQAQVRLLDAGHNADTFLTKEFVFNPDALKLVRYRRIMFVLAFILPLLLIACALYLNLTFLAYGAIASVFAGLLLERWLFFAEARHVVRLYHGDQRT